MIESKYTIEYVNPEPEKKNKPKPRKSIIGFIFSGFFLAGLVLLLLTNIPKNTANNPITKASTETTSTQKQFVATNSNTIKTNQVAPTQEKHTPVDVVEDATNTENKDTITTLTVDKKLIVNPPNTANKKTTTSDKPTEVNTEVSKLSTATTDIEKSLTNLKTQLLETQRKNKELATELDAQIMENMELSTLLEDSLYKINKEDKSYINELEKLEKNTIATPSKAPPIKDPETKKERVSATVIEDENSTKEASKKSIEPIDDSSKAPNNKNSNQVDLSTFSQVNAIIAAMQNKTNSSVNNLKSEAPKVELQDEINQIINNKNTGDINNFQKSLDKI